MRHLCKKCHEKPVAINYYKGKKAYYRSVCDSCARGYTAGVPRWKQLGYQKKSNCEKCGYHSNHPEQFNVFHIDGELENCRPSNLKTICANCQRLLQKEGIRWKQGDLVPDF